jgi:signal transduction histidine kinase
MNIFRQLRWQLTFSYTIVTVSALLVVSLIMGGLVFTRVFLPENYLSPERLIELAREQDAPLLSHILSQSPVDTKLINMLLTNTNATITSQELFSLGAVQFSVMTKARVRMLIIGPDGILLGSSDARWRMPHSDAIGRPFDVNQLPGLEAPLKAAVAGETDSKRLYTMYESLNRSTLAIPVFSSAGRDNGRVVGVEVVILDYFPTQADILWHILNLALRSLFVLLLGVGIMGAIFGAISANRLATRFKRLSMTTDRWSEGDFSSYIDDSTGDEIAQFTRRLNDMARQLQSLLRRRQEMAVSEERSRLARDLHDSAKQQALAASFELGTALTLYEHDPQGAKKHLVEADALVDSVRKELTNLVEELRPPSLEGQDFSETLKEHADEWSHRSGIKLQISIQGDDELSLETRETLFRIVQEALANIARHSSASCADVSLDCGTSGVTLTVKDNGRGFDPHAPHAGLGLSSMRERAEASGGSFAVESAPDQGTQVRVTLPKVY